MKRYAAINTAAIAAAVAGASEASEARNKKDMRPNIVYIMSDDHSMQTISAYGYGLNETPNIDGIAENGILLRNNFVSNSISGPCRATVLTGKFSHENGYIDNAPGRRFDGSQQTFPKLLQEAGYRTAVVGKWHLGSDPTGFDWYSIHTGQGTYYSPVMIEPEGKHTYHGEYATDLTLEKSIGWIEKTKNEGKPFCLMMHFKAPHRSWIPSTEKLEMYEDTVFPVPETFRDDYDGRKAAAEQKMTIEHDMTLGQDLKMLWTGNTEGVSAKGAAVESMRMTEEQKAAFRETYGRIYENFHPENMSSEELAEWKYQRYMRDYCKVISSVDDMVGKMTDYLKEAGLWENTIVIYTSDQGFYMGEHGWFDKRFMYEESLHTPLLISYPSGIEARGEEISAMTQNIDIAPTLLDFAGAKIPADIQGKSMKPLLTGKKAKIRDAVYYHYYEFPMPHAVKKHYGVRDGRYKLIHFYHDIDEWELYDIEKDPHELRNLIDDPEYEGVKRMMHKKLVRLQKQYGDTEPEADI